MAKRDYTADEVQRGLVGLVYANGSPTQARRELKDDGLDIPAATLKYWARKSHKEDFELIKAEQGPKLRERAAEEHLAASRRFMSNALKMNEKLEREMDDIPARDLPGGIRNAMTSAGISADKFLTLRGEPQVVIHQSAEDLLRQLQARVGQPAKYVDSTATEEPVAQLKEKTA